MSRKQSLWLIIIFCITLLLSFIVNLPVRHILKFVQLPADIEIHGLHGTISNGMIEALRYQSFQLSDIDYEIQPLCLFTASLCYRFKSEDKELFLNTDFNLITQNSSISQSKILLNSDDFKDIPQLLAQPKGLLLVKLDRFTLVDAQITVLEAKVDWLDAGIQGEDQLLGNYFAQISKETDKLSIRLNDKGSLLTVNGDIAVKWNGQYDIDLAFETKPTLNKAVISVMQMLTTKSGLNRFSIKRSGTLPARGLKHLKLFGSNL